MTVHPVRDAERIQRPYQGTYMSARRYVMKTFSDSKSQTLRAKAERFLESRALSGVRRQPAAPRGAGGDVRGPDHRGAGRAAARRPGRLPRPDRRFGGRPRPHRGSARAYRAGHRAGPRLSQPRPRHPDPLGGRTPAAASGHAAAFRPLRGRVRPRRAVGRAAPGGHGGAAHGPRPAEGGRQLGVRRGAPPRRHARRRLARRRGPEGGRARRAGAAQRPGGGAGECHGVGDGPVPLRPLPRSGT